MKRIRIIMVVSSLFALMLIQQSSVASNHDTCNGNEATVEGHEGTEGDDVIIAEGSPSLVRAYGGNDTICVYMDEEDPGHVDVFAGEGDDWVYVWGEYSTSHVWGEEGNDHLKAEADQRAFLIGGPGDDRYEGHGPKNVAVLEGVGAVEVDFATGAIETEDGTDTLDGVDAVLGGPDDDVFRGTNGRQFINGGAGNDRIFGGPGADAIDGGAGDDIIRGDKGRDLLSGGLGNDDIRGNKGVDHLWLQPYLESFKVTETFPFYYPYGDEGFEYKEIASGVRASLYEGYVRFDGAEASLKGIENIYSYVGDDVLIGDGRDNRIFGHNGADRIFGYGGNDRLYGGLGYDRINGGAGSDLCVSGKVYKKCEQTRR